MGKLFGTDGVRGIANTELTPELAYALGRAGAYVLTNERAPRILVGRDTRVSGDMLECALTAGLCSAGANVYIAKVIPTPGIAYLVNKYQMDAGVVISASHNLFQDNGIKFFNGNGYKLLDSVEEEIESLIHDINNNGIPRPEGAGIGRRIAADSALQDYAEYLRGTVSGRLEGMRIALDCANGATSVIAPMVFEGLGAHIFVINNKPDGFNINRNCGSTHLEALCEYVVKVSADIGLAFDGDGDRLLAVDAAGNIITGDEIMSILAIDLKNRGKLVGNTLVATVMSNLGLKECLEKNGINLVQTQVGDRYVLERMLADGFTLGGEQSGHIIMLGAATSGDGVLTALRLTDIMLRGEKSLAELNCIRRYPQVTVNVKIANRWKEDWNKDEDVAGEIARLTAILGDGGRVLVRPSGTEPLLRIMLEGKDGEMLRQEALRLASIMEEKYRS